MKTRLIQE